MIPKFLHQTWKGPEIPAEFAAYRRTWLGHHRDWEHHLWTDDTARKFVKEHYPDFSSVYDGYRRGIQRADAARYLWMHQRGGVYVDLDFECLQPLDDLLAGQRLILGFEPQSHGMVSVPGHEFQRIVGNAFIASVPGHPFWEFLLEYLREYAKVIDPLDATGPYLLTRAIARYPHQDQLTILDSNVLYPADKEACWAVQGDSRRLVLPAEAVAVHHWFGTWWRPDALEEQGAGPEAGEGPAGELFSCLCVTEKRPAFMPWLLWNFNKQNWANKELVIVDSSPEPTIESHANVRVVHMAPGASVPEKRNRALAEARGHWMAWFDDDDWQHPDRLRCLGALLSSGAQIAGPEDTWLINLETGGCQRYVGHNELFFNGLGMFTNTARSSAIELKPVVGSETAWLSRLCRRFSHAVTPMPGSILTTMLSHTNNLCNPWQRWRLNDPLASLIAEVGKQAWADTDEQLEALRDRLRHQLVEAKPAIAVPKAAPNPVSGPLYRLYR